MNRADAARLLALAAAYDCRTVGETDVAAWHLALDGLDPERCKAAIVRHYRESTDRVMPAHIRRLARTTTDLTHGSTGTVADDDGNTLCGSCKLMHRPAEHCSVLVADDSRWRRALAMFRRPAELTNPNPTDAREAS